MNTSLSCAGGIPRPRRRPPRAGQTASSSLACVFHSSSAAGRELLLYFYAPTGNMLPVWQQIIVVCKKQPAGIPVAGKRTYRPGAWCAAMCGLLFAFLSGFLLVYSAGCLEVVLVCLEVGLIHARIIGGPRTSLPNRNDLGCDLSTSCVVTAVPEGT